MTSMPPEPIPTVRVPRPAKPWPYNQDADEPGVSDAGTPASVFGCLVGIVVTVGLVAYHASLYSEARVPDVAGIGAAVSQAIVLAVLFAAATLYRWGHALRRVFVTAGAAGALELGFSLLAHLVVGRGWLPTLLETLFGLGAAAYWAFLIGMFALHMPTWWRGWR